MKKIKPVICLCIVLFSTTVQAQIIEGVKQLNALKRLGVSTKAKVKADIVFTASPVPPASVPKNTKSSFTTAEAVYGAIIYEDPVKKLYKGPIDDGLVLTLELYANDKKLGEAKSYFSRNEYVYTIEQEKVIPLEIIPGENTWQPAAKYIDLLEKIAALYPGVYTIKIKRFGTMGDDVSFTLDATNIATDKARLMRIAERIRNNKKDMKEVDRQHENKIWILPPAAKRDTKLENEIRAALKADLKINATHIVIRDNDWLVWKNQYSGLPESKEISVTYAWKQDGECWIHYDKAFREYLGGGKYSNIHFRRQSTDHLVDCGNLKK